MSSNESAWSQSPPGAVLGTTVGKPEETSANSWCGTIFQHLLGGYYPLETYSLLLKMAIYSGFTHCKWWFSIVMLVYQRVYHHSTSRKPLVDDNWESIKLAKGILGNIIHHPSNKSGWITTKSPSWNVFFLGEMVPLNPSMKTSSHHLSWCCIEVVRIVKIPPGGCRKPSYPVCKLT